MSTEKKNRNFTRVFEGHHTWIYIITAQSIKLKLTVCHLKSAHTK